MHISIALFFSVFSLYVVHPFYISVTDMVYNPAAERLEIAQKIFWDDLEVALGEKYGKKVDFLQPEDQEKLENWIEAYILEHNIIWINGEKLKLSYLGFEVEEDAAWFYMESEGVPAPKEVKVKNTLLFKDFPTQQNIVNFYVGKSPKSTITYSKKPEGEIKF
ncbi:DUF6702 family protein [Pleomorphovibrio marinus]|uniref:DUF6702 family protein n=1 Tax=Pleomorphovibrio marinus TaxID=2164132 RepID=UPI000E0C8D0E|nr:DUF6702 family protein [Pleomorphovibrio marinus]